MKITIIALGTRGDVQPYVALGLGLKAAGHDVRLASINVFEKFVSSQGLNFASLGGISQEFGERVQAVKNRSTLAFHGLLGRVSWWRIFASGFERLLSNYWDVCQGAEAIVYSQLAFPAYHIAEKLRLPCFAAYTHPITRTRAFPYALYTSNFHLDSNFNWLTYICEEQICWQFTRKKINQWRRATLSLPPIPLTGIYPQQQQQQMPILYCYSPAVIPKPTDWPDWAHITGYWFLDRSPNWQPPGELIHFLESGSPPIYIGFGSRNDYNPDAMTELVLSALAKTGQRCILLTGQGGLGNTNLPDNILKIESVPFDWLFPQVAGVIHHGGAGTMAAALRAGVPSFVTPFAADQPFWGEQVAKLGAGYPPIPGKKLTVEGLVAAIEALTNDERMKARALALGEKIRSEDGVARAVELFHRYLPSYKG